MSNSVLFALVVIPTAVIGFWVLLKNIIDTKHTAEEALRECRQVRRNLADRLASSDSTSVSATACAYTRSETPSNRAYASKLIP